MHCTRLKAKGNRAFSFLFFFFPLLVRAPLSIWPFQFDDGKYFAVTNKQLQPPVLTHRSAAPAMRIPVLLSVQPALHTAQHPATQQHIPANIHMHTLQQRKKKAQCFFSCSPPRTKPIRRDTREAWMWLAAPHGTHSPIPAPRCWRGHAALRKSGLRLTYINTNHKKPKHSERETLSARKHRKIKAVAAPQRKHSHPSASELQQGSPAPLLKAENAFFHPPRTEPRKAGGGPGPSSAASPGLTPAAAGTAARPRAAPSAGRSADAAGCRARSRERQDTKRGTSRSNPHKPASNRAVNRVRARTGSDPWVLTCPWLRAVCHSLEPLPRARPIQFTWYDHGGAVSALRPPASPRPNRSPAPGEACTENSSSGRKKKKKRKKK